MAETMRIGRKRLRLTSCMSIKAPKGSMFVAVWNQFSVSGAIQKVNIEFLFLNLATTNSFPFLFVFNKFFHF